MTTQSLTDIVADLSKHANALAALGAAIESRVSSRPLDARMAPHIAAISDVLGASAALSRATELELQALLSELRTFALTNIKLLFATTSSSGWQHDEPQLLEAAGEVSRSIPQRLKHTIAPSLDGLSERLELENAAFLDVGVGVAAMSIEMAKLWPKLRIVGIEPLAPALTLARQRVCAAQLGQRIELREQRAETLEDHNAYDLAWIPSLFIAEASLEHIVQRVANALRPGAWLIMPMYRPTPDLLVSHLAALRTALFGGTISTVEAMSNLLSSCGLTDTRALVAPTNSISTLLVARKQ